MDASAPQSPGTATASSPAPKRPWYLRRFGIAFALGVYLALAAVPINALISFFRDWAIGNRYLYQHQVEVSTWLLAIGLLLLPLVILVVAFVAAIRGSANARLATLLRLGAVTFLLLVLTWSEWPLYTAIYRAEVAANTGPVADAANPFIWAQILLSSWDGIAVGLALMLLIRLLASRVLPSARVPRSALAALMGGLAGLAVGFFAVWSNILLITIEDVRLIYVGIADCGGDPYGNCLPTQLWQLTSADLLPTIVGAALGGVIGALLIPSLRAATASRATTSLPNPPNTARQPRRFASIALAATYLVFGVACALLLNFVIGHAGGSIPPLGSSGSYGVYTILPLFALLIPALLIALAASSASRTSAPRAASRRWLLGIIAVLGVAGALALPLSLLVWQQLLASAPTPATMLEGFCLGAGLAAITMLRAPDPTWRIGLRAAFIGWLGFALVGLVIAVQIFYGYVIPGADFNTSTCHGLGCGALYTAFVDFSLSVCIGLVLNGFLAALLAGGLVGALGSTRPAPTPLPSAAPIE